VNSLITSIGPSQPTHKWSLTRVFTSVGSFYNFMKSKSLTKIHQVIGLKYRKTCTVFLKRTGTYYKYEHRYICQEMIMTGSLKNAELLLSAKAIS
jgi:hypothetical protein